jgi:hypothetical protein
MSPWVFGYARHAHALQDSVVGGLLLVAAATSALMGTATAVPLWFALALGVWTFLTPMMFGQAGPSFSANNDVVIGLLTVLASAAAIVSRARLRLFASDFDPHAASEQTSLW